MAKTEQDNAESGLDRLREEFTDYLTAWWGIWPNGLTTS